MAGSSGGGLENVVGPAAIPVRLESVSAPHIRRDARGSIGISDSSGRKCPKLYSYRVMEERCRRAGARAIAGVGGSIVFGFLASPSIPLTGDVALVLFAMGGWNLVTHLQLRSVRRLIAHLTRRGSNSGTQGLSA